MSASGVHSEGVGKQSARPWDVRRRGSGHPAQQGRVRHRCRTGRPGCWRRVHRAGARFGRGGCNAGLARGRRGASRVETQSGCQRASRAGSRRSGWAIHRRASRSRCFSRSGGLASAPNVGAAAREGVRSRYHAPHRSRRPRFEGGPRASAGPWNRRGPRFGAVLDDGATVGRTAIPRARRGCGRSRSGVRSGGRAFHSGGARAVCCRSSGARGRGVDSDARHRWDGRNIHRVARYVSFRPVGERRRSRVIRSRGRAGAFDGTMADIADPRSG